MDELVTHFYRKSMDKVMKQLASLKGRRQCDQTVNDLFSLDQLLLMVDNSKRTPQ